MRAQWTNLQAFLEAQKKAQQEGDTFGAMDPAVGALAGGQISEQEAQQLSAVLKDPRALLQELNTEEPAPQGPPGMEWHQGGGAWVRDAQGHLMSPKGRYWGPKR